jgi:CRISPR/Cas system-associated endonuclease Cas1
LKYRADHGLAPLTNFSFPPGEIRSSKGLALHFIENAGLWLSVRAGELAIRQRDGRYVDLDRRIKTIVAAGHGFAVTGAAVRYCSAKHIELLISDDAATFVSMFAPTSAANSSRAA